MEKILRNRKGVSPAVTASNVVNGSSLVHEEELDVQFISAYKGRGVFASKEIEKGAFIVEYRDENESYHEGERRLLLPGVGSFLFFVGKKTCIDASQHEGKGKLINDSVDRKKDTKQDVEAVPISPTSVVHQGCSVSSKPDEVSKPQITDASIHMTDATQVNVEAVPVSPLGAEHKDCSVISRLDKVPEPQTTDTSQHMTDNGVSSESENNNDEEEIHEADDLTENAIEEDMETVPVSTLGAVHQGCSVRSNPDKVTEPQESGNYRPKTGEVVKLTEVQHRLLKTLFKTNIAMRRELQKDECEKVSRKYEALQNLTWKKIKNTVYNWIMAEKRKTKRY